jgi:hypothetical protein
MKRITIFCYALLSSVFSFSQQTPESFLGHVPAIPSNVCGISSAGQKSFSVKAEEVSDQIKEAISRRKQEYKDFVGDNKDQMIQNMAGQSGLSAADMAKLKNGGQLSQAEAMTLANKMMGEKYNMSVGEAKNLGKMSKEGQKAWAEGYGTEMMADAQANPDKYNKDQKKNKNMYDLASEQTQLAQQIQAEEAKFQNQLEEINQKAAEERLKLDVQLAPLIKESEKINDGEGSTAADAARGYAFALKIYELRLKFCELMTPFYTDFLSRRLLSVKINLPNHYRLQEITDNLTAEQTGIKKGKMTPDLMALESISRYMTLLADLFRFSPGDKPTKI